jgi:hypothetical protein
LDQIYIVKVLANWPERIYLILKARGFHIEHRLKLMEIKLVKIGESFCIFFNLINLSPTPPPLQKLSRVRYMQIA